MINEIESEIHRVLIETQIVHAKKVDAILYEALAYKSPEDVENFFKKTQIEHAHTVYLPGHKGTLTLTALINTPALKETKETRYDAAQRLTTGVVSTATAKAMRSAIKRLIPLYLDDIEMNRFLILMVRLVDTMDPEGA